MINLIEAWRQEDENFYVFALRFLNSMKSYLLFAIKKGDGLTNSFKLNGINSGEN